MKFATNLNLNWTTLGFVIALATMLCRPLPAQTGTNQTTQPQIDSTNIQLQIALLGDVDPTTRQKAQAELRRMGAAAIDELDKAAKFETTLDYETQTAAVKILESIKDEIALEETNKFVHGKTTLLGWDAFKEFAGDTPESRSLFRDIYLRNRSELTKAMRPSSDGNLISYLQLSRLFASPDLEQVCFGMFLLARQQIQQNTAQSESELPLLRGRHSEKQLEDLLRALTRPTSPLTKLRTNIKPSAKLVRAIIETAPQEHPILQLKLALVQQFNSPEIGPLLVEFAKPKTPSVVRALAIAHAIKIGDAETFTPLKSYLNDNTVVGQFLTGDAEIADPTSKNEPTDQLVSEVRIRDIVLLGDLRLNGKAHADFGFDPEAVNISTNVVDIKRAGFTNDLDRKNAFKLYQPSSQP